MTRTKWVIALVLCLMVFGSVSIAYAQNPPAEPPDSKAPQATAAPQPPARAELPPVERHEIIVPQGTRVPMQMMNYVSSKTAKVGDAIYLETIFPVAIGNRVVVPVGSYVRGTITQVERSGRVKGRAEMYVRFDSLTLPNGVTRDFNATVSQTDARVPAAREGEIKADGSKGRDATTIAGGGLAGAGIGGLAGISSGHSGMGTAIGAGAGALGGLIAVLASRGNEVELYRGAEVDMTLDRNLIFDESELSNEMGRPAALDRYNQPNQEPHDRKRSREYRDYRDPFGLPQTPFPN